MNDSLLRTGLLDLLHALGKDAQGILLGGGYGLYLKQLHLVEAGVRTLICADLWPAPRATQDLDLMLSAELVADARSMTALRTALDKLEYEVIKGSEYLQFVRTITATQVVKIDLLTAQIDVLNSIPAIRADSRRARPAAADRPELHAHPTDGALTLVQSYAYVTDLLEDKAISGMNPETQQRYDANRLTITRQLRYSSKHGNTLDVTLALNGTPVATAELKNPMTAQNWRHAVTQYKHDRDPADPIFQFKRRTLVHFAVDTDEVHMTTRLSGGKTHFLPFNRGCADGAGNPGNPGGYKTAYLWEEVLERHSFLDILARFIHLQVEEKRLGGKKVKRETMIFPRYHQLACVREIVADAQQRGVGTNYLVQHSAGSGKSNSIAWLAHRLSSLYDERDEKVFDSVIVVTDRVVLDQQLQNTVYQFEHKQGVVEKIEVNSAQLADALAAGVPIVITTLQKFPFVTEKIGDLPKKRYAVIIDEAHSSQGGETATELKGVLAGAAIREEARAKTEAEGLPDYEEEILKAMAKRGRQPNISFFAFTATPKYKTMEVFGRPGEDGKPEAFHRYSMRQAIEEGFILDVLRHYTTYTTYYRLIKSIEDDPRVDKRKAARALARFMSLHPHNIAQKTEVMVEHFRHVTMHRIGGKAKAMVVTSSRLHAVRYKQAFDRYIAEKGYKGIKTLVAFSGTVIDPDAPGVEYTESGMNIDAQGRHIGEKELPERFATEEYQVLLVAEKYQTGFDQPLLHTMYVDKRLAGIQAVQTLSRLNRKHPGKEDTFVLDFVNEPDEILAAFQPYYEQTLVGEQADPRQLYEMQAKLDSQQVYHKAEVEEFCRVFYRPRRNQTAADHARMWVPQKR